MVIFKSRLKISTSFTLEACASFDILYIPPASSRQQSTNCQIDDSPAKEEYDGSIREANYWNDISIFIVFLLGIQEFSLHRLLDVHTPPSIFHCPG